MVSRMTPAAVHSFFIEDEIGVSTVIDSAKNLYRLTLLSTGTGNSVSRYWQMLQLQHQDYVLALYLSAIQNFRSHRLVSTFRCGYHASGLHVHTGKFRTR